MTSTRQACFFSLLNPRDSSANPRTTDWTGPVHGSRMVLYKQSNRPDHDCVYCFNLRRAQDANLVFHRSCSVPIILYDNMVASALDMVVTFAGEVLFQREGSDFNQAGGESWRQNRLAHMSGQHEQPHALNEKEANVFSFPV